MEKLVLFKEKLPELLDKIISKYVLFGPKQEKGITEFKQISDSKEVHLEQLQTRVPPKALMFGQTETLFTYTLGKKSQVNSPKFNEEKRVVFGIKSCDAKSYKILDTVFEGDVVDPFYSAKRKRTILIGLSCNQPDTNCFCTSFDNGPASTKYVDILFTDIDDKYYVEIITPIGKELVGEMKSLFSEPSEKDGKTRMDIEEKAIKSISRQMNTEGIVEKLDKMFNHEFWQKISMRCIGCGVCTYLCPTCHCFDIQDESSLKFGARIRVWDSCMYPEYTMHASGHNPRPARMNRIRNRVYHKFNYFPKNSEIIACTGCGRCISNCPVNIDIIDVITKVKEVEI